MSNRVVEPVLFSVKSPEIAVSKGHFGMLFQDIFPEDSAVMPDRESIPAKPTKIPTIPAAIKRDSFLKRGVLPKGSPRRCQSEPMRKDKPRDGNINEPVGSDVIAEGDYFNNRKQGQEKKPAEKKIFLFSKVNDCGYQSQG